MFYISGHEKDIRVCSSNRAQSRLLFVELSDSWYINDLNTSTTIACGTNVAQGRRIFDDRIADIIKFNGIASFEDCTAHKYLTTLIAKRGLMDKKSDSAESEPYLGMRDITTGPSYVLSKQNIPEGASHDNHLRLDQKRVKDIAKICSNNYIRYDNAIWYIPDHAEFSNPESKCFLISLDGMHIRQIALSGVDVVQLTAGEVADIRARSA